MNGLDWVLAGIAVFCVIRGLMRGAVSQVFGIAGLIGGFLVAAHHHQGVGTALTASFPDLPSPSAIGFAILFFLTWCCFSIVGFMLSNLLHKTGLGSVDRIWGGGVGLGKAVILAMVLISTMTFFLSPQSELLRQSRVAPYVQQAAVLLVSITPASMRQVFHEKKKQLDSYWSQRHKPQTSTPSTTLQREASTRQ